MRFLEASSGVFYFESPRNLALHAGTIRSRVHTWLRDNMGERGFYDQDMGIVPMNRRWAVVPGTTKNDSTPSIYFRTKDDAMMFKLIWAGYDASL